MAVLFGRCLLKAGTPARSLLPEGSAAWPTGVVAPGARWSPASTMAFALLDLETGERRTVAAFEPDLPSTRLNDGRTDRQGRFVAGGMDEDALAPISSVWRLDPDLTATKLFGAVGCANGTCFSPDGNTMWFADSAAGDIEAIRLRPAVGNAPAIVGRSPARRRPGSPTDPASTARASSGTRSGKAIASSAMRPMDDWTGSSRSPSRSRPAVPSAAAICPHFSSRARVSANHRKHLEREPTAGALFAVRPGVSGCADTPFGG